jgi:hypothetical protein
MILSENVSDEKIFLFFSLLDNSIPHLVRLSDLWCMTLPLQKTLASAKRLEGLEFSQCRFNHTRFALTTQRVDDFLLRGL